MKGKPSARNNNASALKGSWVPVFLAFSLLINLALGFWCFRMNSRAPQPVVNPPSPSSAAPSKAAPLEAAAPTQKAAGNPTSSPASFAWSSLESEDFHVYISRLRAIGCPELTLRSIIKGELDEIYADKKRQLAAGRGERGRGVISVSLQKEFDQLSLEEDRVLAELLGLARPDVPGVSPTLTGAPKRMAAFENMQAAVNLAQPLVFQQVDTTALNLTPAQQERIEALRQEFLRMIGGAQQNPQDPEYLARWRKAQYYVDNVMRTTFGNDFVNRYRAALVK